VDEPTQKAKFKRRRSRVEIEELVALYEGSGLGGATFCQQQGLSRSTFAGYRKRQEQTVRKAAEGKRWLAVEVSSSAAVGSVSGLAVVLPSGRRIEVGRGFDADTLKRLLAVVELG
jgi:outer membrane lipoprotein SlyB